METFWGISVLIFLNIFCWALVFNKSLRYRLQRKRYEYWKLNEEQQEMSDASFLARLIAIGMLISLISLCALASYIYEITK
jgi:cbb3-type cytochrome oxidase subunit 3